ncbi:hypothetical protein J6TS2_33720 [Heyndrickxia sporothermodurans]|nr:hypothetical protein J6TS2_33720 [Heyndrickxia sporothermodurans]
MSFVSIIVRKNFITVMSDGQVTQEGEVIRNDYQKFKKISPHQFIAYTGAKEICEQIVNQVPFTNNNYHLFNIAKQIESVINESKFDNFRLFFAVGGIEIDGNITSFTIEHGSSRNFKELVPKDKDDICYAFLNSEVLDSINLEEKLILFFRRTGFNKPEECLQTQKLLNDFVEGLDSTVNNKTFSLTIKK